RPCHGPIARIRRCGPAPFVANTSHRTAPKLIDIGSPRPLKELLSLFRPHRTCCVTARLAAVASTSHDEFAVSAMRSPPPTIIVAQVLVVFEPRFCRKAVNCGGGGAVLAFIQPGRANKIHRKGRVALEAM